MKAFNQPALGFLGLVLASCSLSTAYAAEAQEPPIHPYGREVQAVNRRTTLESLEQVSILESARIGFAAQPSENLRLLRSLLAEGDAANRLQQLYASGTLAAKLYAIIGMQLIGQDAEAGRLLDDLQQFADDEVQVMEGCVIRTLPLQEVLPELTSGRYAKSFSQSNAEPH